MTTQHPKHRSPAADNSCFSKCHSLLVLLGIAIFSLLPFPLLHATSYKLLGLGEMVDGADLIVVAELTPSREQLTARIENVLKGQPPQGFELSGKISSYPADGKMVQYASFDNATVKLADLIPSKQRIFFLRADREGRFRTFHPACILEADKRQRVSQILAMAENPSPFVMTEKYAGDLDLIYLLGVNFHALRVMSPTLPGLEHYMSNYRGIIQEIPWQPTRLTLQFSYQESRQPMIQMEPLKETGVLADFIRRMDARKFFDSYQKESKVKLPPSFSVIVDTNGPEKVGELSFNDAAKFLREQLRSKNSEVVSAAYEALAKLMDRQTVQIANSMLSDPDINLRAHAANFIGYARDPNSIIYILGSISELPQKEQGYNRDLARFSDLLGVAVLNLNEPKAVPELKRVIYKGYAGDGFAAALARLGDESAFEILLYHIRNPYVDHYPSGLVTLIRRSNQSIEPWMNIGYMSETAESQRQAEQWIAWWDAHKAEFRIVRTWEEANRQPNR